MIDLWPEEDSPALRLGGVFDEVTRPPKTGQEIVDEWLECAAELRATGKPVPEFLERAERGKALESFMTNKPGCSWLSENRPLGRIEDLVEHWRNCANCQEAARAERERRRH